MTPSWQFWIDVGGTFTDCIARRPDGSLMRHKVLSSAVTKGTVGNGSHRHCIMDPARGSDPADFWRGYTLSVFNARGDLLGSAPVAEFHAPTGQLLLARPLPLDPEPHLGYELHGDEDAPLLAIRYLMGVGLDQQVPPVSVRLGTTRGTNALITRRGARTALVTTRGFGDILEIGYQNRPRLFDLAIRKPQPILAATLEIDERVDARGEVQSEPDWEEVRQGLAGLRDEGVESLAICLLHAYANAAHEQRVARLARDVGFQEISCSSSVAPVIKIVARGDTTSVDAYLNPVLRGYVRKLRSGLGDSSDLRMLTSAGGLVDADRFLGKDSILSGPAGGVVGFSKVAAAAGYERAIGFDMGGTSTDVTRFDGTYELQYETEKSGVRVVAPMMAIETVAAGGGSICAFDGVKLTVGPDSAGADPGPACYGRGGPLTVTDLNFFSGRILAEEFPFALDRDAVTTRLEAVAQAVAEATGRHWDLRALATGFLRVANANMAKAVRSISVARGYDPRDYLLVSFGGAAPQHACAIASELGMATILNHPDAGILSALGIGMADVVRHRVAGVYRHWSPETTQHVESLWQQLAQQVVDDVLREGIQRDRIELTRSLDLRYVGVDAYLTIRQPPDGDYPTHFSGLHQQRYGYVHHDRPLEVVAVRVQGVGRSEVELIASQHEERQQPKPDRFVDVDFSQEPSRTAVYARTSLEPGDFITGPAIITETVSTTVVDPGWTAEVLSHGELLIERASKGIDSPATAAVPQPDELDRADPIELELFNNRFAGIAEKMGLTLRNTSSSVNVKERLDFSCALFTPTGDLVVNAPHIPVHLGAMSETVKCLIADNPHISPGDVFVTNDPFRGGSHLPDITVITPVHDTAGGDQPRLLFFTASRAHHAEVGGIAPGSMPPFSKSLAEEGVLIRNFKLLSGGRSRHGILRDLLSSAPYPSRSVEENMADLEAQVAANQQGARELLALIDDKGLRVTQAYMHHIQTAAETKMRAALGELPDGRYRFLDHLDNGAPIQVHLTIDGQQAHIDFTGTGPVLSGNLNANRAIVTAAVMYVFRCMIDEDIPLNQGVLTPLQIKLPSCLLNPPSSEDPHRCAAVAGGNVETSQRIVDVLLGALGLAAASQGTMNNVLFGNATFGYYETICGGSGATSSADGASAVHTHMTNTRLTDPEVLEQRYPIRVQRFAIRRGSGGAGRQRGGDGVVREIEFLTPLEVSLLTQRRGPFAPYGLDGGKRGAVGSNRLLRADGHVEQLDALAHFTAGPGDRLIIETPGGGGFGSLQRSIP
jgi:5-oxoprolinase (ATP-hydrolysing)